MSASRSSSGSIVSRACRLKAGHALDRHRRDHAECTDADAGDPQQIGVRSCSSHAHDLTRAVDELDADHDRRGEVAPLASGAVGRGADRTGHRLHVDVAQVRHRQPDRVELVGERPQRDPGVDRDPPTLGVDVAHRSHPLERQQHARRHRRRGERVAGADHLDALLLPVGGGHDRRHLVGRRRVARPATARTPRCPPSCARIRRAHRRTERVRSRGVLPWADVRSRVMTRTVQRDLPPRLSRLVRLDGDGRGRRRRQAARQPRSSLQLRRAVPEGQPLPRPRLLPRPRPAPAAPRRPQGQRTVRADLVGRGARPRSAAGSNAIIAEHGGEAVMPFSDAGNQSILATQGISDRFFNHIGATQLLRNICGPTVGAGVSMTNGTGLCADPLDLEHSQADPGVGHQHPAHQPPPLAGDRARPRQRGATGGDRPDPHADRRRGRPVRPAAARHRRGDDAGDDARHHRRGADRRGMDRRAHARLRRARRARRRLDAGAGRGRVRRRRRGDRAPSPASTPPPARPRSAP